MAIFLTSICKYSRNSYLKSPLDSKEIKPVNPKGNQPWIFIGRTDAEAEIPILWPPGVKSQLIGKDPDPGKDWRQEDRGMTEDEMLGWHHQLNGHEFEQTAGDSKWQGSLAFCSPWGCRVRHDWVTEQQQKEFIGNLCVGNLYAFLLNLKLRSGSTNPIKVGQKDIWPLKSLWPENILAFCIPLQQ